MKYSIQLREGWIGFYDCRNGRYGVTANAPERIRCSYRWPGTSHRHCGSAASQRGSSRQRE